MTAKKPSDCTFCKGRAKKGLGPCGHHGGPGNPKKKKAISQAPKPAPKPSPRPSAAPENGVSGKALAAHIRQLHADIERGETAKEELADIKKALAGL